MPYSSSSQVREAPLTALGGNCQLAATGCMVDHLYVKLFLMHNENILAGSHSKNAPTPIALKLTREDYSTSAPSATWMEGFDAAFAFRKKSL